MLIILRVWTCLNVTHVLDPTAGPSMLDKSLWYLDETGLNENIKKTLGKFCGPTPIVYSDVNSLFLSSTEPPAAAEYSSLLRPLR